jgi:ribosomal protein S12 methylthiotransferase
VKPTSFYLLSLGCPKNRIDAEVMAAALADQGHRPVDNPENAELLLVNTCAFIQAAQEEAIDAILAAAVLKKRHPSRRLIVTGCLPQRFGCQLHSSLPEVDLFLGVDDVPNVARAVAGLCSGKRQETDPPNRPPAFLMTAAHRRLLSTPTHTAYLKIAEGCSHRCSYCVIPRIRGRARSRSVEDLVREAEILAGQGVRELILVAQDTTAYGLDRGDSTGLAALLRALSKIAGIAWIRLLYGHPDHVNADLLRQLAGEEKACAYLDLPIQHIHDAVLAAMKRPGRRRQIEAAIALARSLVPGIALRTSLIVGFPGETEKRFEALLTFVREIRFDHLGVFTYSREAGTVAARYPSRIS